jgi:hypothetical protein
MFLDLMCKVSRSPQEVWERIDMRTAHTSVSAVSLSAVYQGRWLYIWTSALNWYEIQLHTHARARAHAHTHTHKYCSSFVWFPILVRPNLTLHTAARMHLQQTFPWQYIFVLVPPSPQEVWEWSFSTPCIYISIQCTYTSIQYIYYFQCNKNVRDSHPKYLVWFVPIGL